MVTLFITDYGKGGSTSEGDWHVRFNQFKQDYKGRQYTSQGTRTFFRKRDMLRWLENPNNTGVKVVMQVQK